MMNSGKISGVRINKILTLAFDLSPEELSLLIEKLRAEQYQRNKGKNIDTTQI